MESTISSAAARAHDPPSRPIPRSPSSRRSRPPLADTTRASTVEEVIERLRAIEQVLPHGDGVQVFTRLYRRFTEYVNGGLHRGRFLDPVWLARLDVVFANLFLRALEQHQSDPASAPRAWRPLFAARSSDKPIALQFALAGMNAHINRDLMEGVVQACAELGLMPAKGTRQHADFLTINELLDEARREVKAWFLDGLIAKIDRLGHGLDDVVAQKLIVEARHAAWANAAHLWAVREQPEAFARHIDTVDTVAGLLARGILAA